MFTWLTQSKCSNIVGIGLVDSDAAQRSTKKSVQSRLYSAIIKAEGGLGLEFRTNLLPKVFFLFEWIKRAIEATLRVQLPGSFE